MRIARLLPKECAQNLQPDYLASVHGGERKRPSINTEKEQLSFVIEQGFKPRTLISCMEWVFKLWKENGNLWTQQMQISNTIDSYWSIDMSWQLRVFCRKFLNQISTDTDQLDALTSASVSSDHADVDIRMLWCCLQRNKYHVKRERIKLSSFVRPTETAELSVIVCIVCTQHRRITN